jgi:hypothetical protein
VVTDLVARLTERLDETERIARAATPGPWRYNPAKQWHAPADLAARRNGEEYVAAGSPDNPVCVAVTGAADNLLSMADARFIALHDPAAVLRVVAAHRKILDLHASSEYRINYGGIPRTVLQCEHCASLCHSGSGLSCDSPDAPYPCETVQIVAEAYGVEEQA